ncbi:hypothetical protein GHO35_20875, partial [Pseudomonas helleri]|nr:hypothetical protein [Pseudomonas helleri]
MAAQILTSFFAYLVALLFVSNFDTGRRQKLSATPDLSGTMLRERLSPEQIAGKLRSMNIPSLRD